MANTFYILGVIFLIFQIFLTFAGLSFLVESLTKRKVTFRASTGVFFIPFFFFYARNVHIIVRLGPKKDSLNLKMKSIQFWISPIELFRGKARIKRLKIKKLRGQYISRIPSKEKIKWLPPDGKALLINGSLIDGDLFIIDKTRFPAYTIHLKDIHLSGVNMDLGHPAQILFFSKKGNCKIGSGVVQAELLSPNHGIVKVSGVTWGEFMNMDQIPIQPLKSSVELHAEYKHNWPLTNFRGVMGRRAKARSIQASEEGERFGFNFDFNWNENKLTIDLVLRKIILDVFSGTLVDGVVNSTMTIVRDSIFAFLDSGKGIGKMISSKVSSSRKKKEKEKEEEIIIDAEVLPDEEIQVEEPTPEKAIEEVQFLEIEVGSDSVVKLDKPKPEPELEKEPKVKE